MAAGNEFCAVGILSQQADGVGERGCANVIECCRNHWGTPVRVFWIADQTRGGVIGMSRCFVPNGGNASSTGGTMHWRAPIHPVFRRPLTPDPFESQHASSTSD